MTRRLQTQLAKALIAVVAAIVFLLLQRYHVIQPTPAKPPAQTVPAGSFMVAKFDDGDTLRIQNGTATQTVRFLGVDTPETHDPRKPVQCFGQAAASYTKQLIGTNPVRLESDSSSTDRDKYNRLLRYVYLPDGTLVNKKIIEEGYGFATPGFTFIKRSEFVAAESSAKAAHKGLWGSCSITTPNGYNQTNSQ